MTATAVPQASVRFPTLWPAAIRGEMGTIVPFLRTGEHAFDPKDVAAMATALDDVCNILNLNDDSSARETVAVRIIDLAKAGERNSTWLRDRVLHEARHGGPCWSKRPVVGIK